MTVSGKLWWRSCLFRQQKTCQVPYFLLDSLGQIVSKRGFQRQFSALLFRKSRPWWEGTRQILSSRLIEGRDGIVAPKFSAEKMENNQQKWVNLTFVATALLLAYVVFLLSTKFSVVFDVEGRVRHLDKILMAASAVIGIGTFLLLNKNALANTFMNETVAELAKVTWPTQDETLKATIAVLIAVTICGVILWMMDNAWIYLIGVVLG